MVAVVFLVKILPKLIVLLLMLHAMLQKILLRQVLLIAVKFKFLMPLALQNRLPFTLKPLAQAKFLMKDIVKLVREHFDLRPYGIIKMLDLLQPIYRQTAAMVILVVKTLMFTWEKTDKADALREAAGLSNRIFH